LETVITFFLNCTEGVEDNVNRFMSQNFPNCTLVESFGRGGRQYDVGRLPSLAKAFEILQSNKSEYGIESYSISQTSLEQVFLYFAKQQEGALLDPKAIKMTCIHCQEHSFTQVEYKLGSLAMLLMLGLGCCCIFLVWIPLVSNRFKDRVHRCSKCHQIIAMERANCC